MKYKCVNDQQACKVKKGIKSWVRKLALRLIIPAYSYPYIAFLRIDLQAQNW